MPTSEESFTPASTATLTNKTFDANGTGNSLSNVDIADLANGTDGELITWDANAAPAAVAAGTATHVLTSNGAGAAPTFQAVATGGDPKMRVATSFETSGRFGQAVLGSGVVSFSSDGLIIDAAAAAASSARATWSIEGKLGIALGSPTFSCGIGLKNKGTDCDSFFGLGNITVATAGITYTDLHIGFKITWASSGAASLYATQADGSTETASGALTTIAANDFLDLILVVNSTTSVDYYWRKNGGSLSSATNLTANLDVALVTGTAGFAVSNKDQSSQTRFNPFQASWER